MEPLQSNEWVEENRYDAPALYYELLATRAAIEALLEQRDVLVEQKNAYQAACWKHGIPSPPYRLTPD